MTTGLIIGGLVLAGLGLVASQLFRLRDWLNRQPPADEPRREVHQEPPDPSSGET